ncbi:conserved hypothetical protein [Theileria orientalis strain Shintoku]|uniref:Uncharacterized protein n=1 Tax=Theileria orientalis strain Shintoku TaxID=869250 RepID=J7MCA7_THEOR|nr:conserved hypothetical protein [Theileria orientalis strain Shintoku]PVC52635.1 hypothetical protein MACL_00000628 [Theileria orientalis]BAM42392.1 conserved hypothetical protein [Theileria orientalis strain Shintoku]|eukprot:XP_009692693.1 conserved hypothetical protein [Theileria orientalis strain Shintoku]
MVKPRARNSIGRSFSRLRSSISNSFKKTSDLPESSSNYGENLNNESFEPSGSFHDHKLMFSRSDNNVRAAFPEPASPDLDDSAPNDEAFGAPKAGHNGAHSRSLEYFNGDSYSAVPRDQHSAPPGDQQLWNEYLKYLNKDEFDRIYREYVDRNGRDFLNVGLRTYIDAVIETKRFRNRCFHVLSRNSAASHSPSYFNHQGISGSSADPLYRSYLTPEPSYARTHDKGHSAYPGNGLGYGYNSNSFGSNETSYSDSNNYNGVDNNSGNLAGGNFTPERASFPQERPGHSAADRPFPAPAAEPVHKFDDFISNYDYLNSYNRFKDFKPLDSPSPSSRAAASGANLPLPGSSHTADTSARDATAELNEQVLSHNEKLRLLEKIGIDDDYIAKRVCSKFSGRARSKAFVGSNEKRSLEEFNLFHKENLKNQLDLNEQLSQELIRLSNLNTPDALNSRLKDSEYAARSTDLFKSTLSDSFAEGSSLFRRISDTIDRNRDASPVNILSMPYS